VAHEAAYVVDEHPAVRYWCPVDAPVEVLGGKWKLVLLYYLSLNPRRNGELRRLIPPITQKMLTQQLRELERDGIVVRTVHEQVPPKVVYSLNPDERPMLEPLLDVLCRWGLDRAERTGATIDVFDMPTGAAEPVYG
jgi:DNA-binding HxlR family transcriptional regulator